MKRNQGYFTAGVLAATLFLAAARLYSRRSRERIPSPEGFNERAVVWAYDRIAQYPPMQYLRSQVSSRATRMVSVGEAADLGCGPGRLVIDLAQRAPGLHVTGLDLSQEMLIHATINARLAGVTARTSFKVGDVGKIPFPDQSLNLIVSTLSLHHWSDPIQAMNEIHRALRPGGAYLIFDLRRDMKAPAWLGIWLATRFIVPGPLRRANEPLGSRNAAYTPWEVALMASESALEGWQVVTGPMWLILEGRK